MRNFFLALPVSLMASGALAQSGATVADNCANHLNTSDEPTVEALLNCLAEMQRSIDELKAVPDGLVEQDVRRIAQAVIDEQPVADNEGDLLPSGIIVASSATCAELGSDWQPFREATGRFIVGAGENYLRAYRQWRPEGSTAGVDLSPYEVLSIGGEEDHVLKSNEMPTHNHAISTGYRSNGTWHDGLEGFPGNRSGNPGTGIDQFYMQNDPSIVREGGHGSLDQVISATGGSIAHNNMPPYIALYFCKKE